MESGSGTTIKNVLLHYQAITRFGLARGLRPGEETTFAKLAEASGQAESNICKVVRAAIAQRIFEEPRPGVIRHSAASRLLAENPGIHEYVATVPNELIPGLKPGAKVIISEAVMPGPDGGPKNMEAMIRSFDLVMSSIQNARERELEDWKRLFRKANSRLQFQGVTSPPGSNHSLLVAVWGT